MSIIERRIKYVIRNIKKKVFRGHAPDFIVVGAQKSGTSSLHYYLSQHPNLLASTPKEVSYFNRNYNFKKGKNWYHRAFIDLDLNKKNYLCFEATPEYLYHSFTAERIYQEYPGIKIIIILRDPVQRAYSSWNMYKNFNPENFPRGLKNEYINDRQNNIIKEFYDADHFPSFEEAIASEMLKIENNSQCEEPSLLRRGIYLPQVKRYHDIFGNESVLIIGFKDLVQTKKEVLNSVLKFLGLQESNWWFLKEEVKNARNYQIKMNKETEEKLNLFYEPHNKALFEYLNAKINW